MEECMEESKGAHHSLIQSFIQQLPTAKAAWTVEMLLTWTLGKDFGVGRKANGEPGKLGAERKLAQYPL